MAYPTAAQFNPKVTSPQAGLHQLTVSNTVQNHPLGTKIRGQDYGTLQYGEGEDTRATRRCKSCGKTTFVTLRRC